MANFITTYQDGQNGLNKGISMGIPKLDNLIGGIQKKKIYGLGGSPKSGKSSLCDFSFVLMPYLDAIANNTLHDIEWIYFSYEIYRIKKEFKFSAFFFANDYGIKEVEHEGRNYPISENYFDGTLLDVNNKVIKVKPEHEKILKAVYKNRIIPLFGEYNSEGVQIKPGKITFFEQPNNPTGMYNYLWHRAESEGQAIKQKYTTKEENGKIKELEKIVGYNPTNPKKITVVITDHIRKLHRERSFSMKENMDKWIEYSVILRNIFGYSFVHICHTNRNIDIERMKFMKDSLYNSEDDIKDSSNLAEECDHLLTIFNPNDDKYNLKTHFKTPLLDAKGNQLYPNYRSIHLVSSRTAAQCPAHIQCNMYGGLNMFGPLI